MADLPLHPRLAHMLLKAVPLKLTRLALVSQLPSLSERDLLRGPSGWHNADLRLRPDVLHEQHDDMRRCDRRPRRLSASDTHRRLVATTNFRDLLVRIVRRASMRSVCCSHSPIRIVLP